MVTSGFLRNRLDVPRGWPPNGYYSTVTHLMHFITVVMPPVRLVFV